MNLYQCTSCRSLVWGPWCHVYVLAGPRSLEMPPFRIDLQAKFVDVSLREEVKSLDRA